MNYFTLFPEVPGSWGPNTILDRSVAPALFERLHFIFHGWEGSELVTSSPCFLVTERLQEALGAAKIYGCEFADVDIEVSAQFKVFYPETVLPKWLWLKVYGKPGEDDVGISSTCDLVVSEKAFEVMFQFEMDECEFEKYNPT